MNNFQETKIRLIECINAFQDEVQGDIRLTVEEYKCAHEILNMMRSYSESLQEVVENRSVVTQLKIK